MSVREADNSMKLEIPAKAENVGLARVAVAAFASQIDFTLGELEEIKVAVSEAVSNAVVHAYEPEPGMVTITCRLYGDLVEVTVADTGRGIPDVEKAREASFSTLPDRMGLGFSFIEAFMDELEVDSAEGRGTRVRMTKRPARHPSDPPGGVENESAG